MSKVSDYIPRKCDATHRIIGAKDHASVQFNIANVDGKGVFTQSYSTICLSGFVRKEGIADAQVNRYVFPRLGPSSLSPSACIVLVKTCIPSYPVSPLLSFPLFSRSQHCRRAWPHQGPHQVPRPGEVRQLQVNACVVLFEYNMVFQIVDLTLSLLSSLRTTAACDGLVVRSPSFPDRVNEEQSTMSDR